MYKGVRQMTSRQQRGTSIGRGEQRILDRRLRASSSYLDLCRHGVGQLQDYPKPDVWQ